MPRTLIMPPARVRRTVTRIAYEVVERNRGSESLLVVGIPKSGMAIARMLGSAFSAIEGRSTEIAALDIEPFRDDRPESQELPRGDVLDVKDRNVLLVDDVLFTGRTATAALDAILHQGRPKSVRLAVLIDRGHREYPIQPDFVGRVIPTKYGERVVVESEGEPSVYLVE